ncbi:hypothetical protein LshimejAT787_0903640 [Lyophyllum shimeji]|uniref:Uncharacterized protein n=1 Tax=Lyophyllum shimeji TaxID=47721 RepID=A0A9P3PT89_LYOSH|nr:hypothetical protein LshimejAT787_0903640 [Lyophyllum shimeji]
MLDSSPVPLPPLLRPLKRSASTASLPTPPRTHHKRKHADGRKRGAYDTDTDHDGSASENDEALVAPKAHGQKHKKRKTETGVAADADEEAFWMSKSDGDVPAPTSTSTSQKQPSPAPALLYRRRFAGAASSSSVGTAPVSPPPSNRKTAAATVVSPPRTPRPKRVFPMRDSPNNPFLASPSSGAVAEDSESPSPSPNPSPHTPAQERPTVTYVFRGVRGTFPNPLYDHEKGRQRSPSARAKLPLEHPDYSPDPHCPPKVLFPATPRKQRQSARVSARRDGAKGRARQRTLEEELRGTLGKRGRSVSGSDGEPEEKNDEDRIMPKKLDFKARAEAQDASPVR